MNHNPLHPWEKGLVNAQAAPRCGAHCRTTGRPCQAPAMGNGRCRMHGGKSPGAPCGAKHGNYSHGMRTGEAREERRKLKAAMAWVKKLTEYV